MPIIPCRIGRGECVNALMLNIRQQIEYLLNKHVTDLKAAERKMANFMAVQKSL